MFHLRLKQHSTMSTAPSLRKDSSRNTVKSSVERAVAAMSLICIVLSGCSAPRQRIIRDVSNAWREHRPLPNIDETLTIDSAYQVQTRTVRAKLAGASPSGFKAGLTSAAAQARFKANDAVAGVLFKEGERRSADTLRLSELRGMHIEVEIAMRIGVAIDRPLADVAALRNHIDGIAPAIEAPNLDYVDMQSVDAVDIVATNVAAANYIVGEFVSPQLRDPNAVAVRLACNEQELVVGKGREALGDQWQAALWLVNKMLAQGWKMQRGQVLLTGALGRAVPAPTGHCVASYQTGAEDWGSLEINVAK
jgi:2-keto-4-pentenoate hydratase